MSKIIPIKCTGAINLKLSDIHEFQGELKTLSKDRYEQLKKSILTLGFSFPENVWLDPEDKKYKILDGHQRFRTVKQMAKEGYSIDKLPCNLVEADNKKQAKQKLLAAASQYGEVTSEGLYEFINEADLKIEDVVADFNFPEIDFEEFEEEFFDNNGAGLNGTDEDAIPYQVPAKTKLGDLYQLGEHRLLCGDSTDIKAVDKLMNGEKADMVLTDPPYGIGFKYNQHEDRQGKEYLDFCSKWFSILTSICEFKVIFTGWKYNEFWYSKKPKDTFYWLNRNKRTGESISNFRKIEPIFIWGKPDKKYDFDYFDVTTKIDQELHKVHTCPKQIELIEQIINGAKPKCNVLDIFGGSGSTLITCEKTKRKCFMMELDPHYCDVIVARWEKFTGKNAKLLK